MLTKNAKAILMTVFAKNVTQFAGLPVTLPNGTQVYLGANLSQYPSANPTIAKATNINSAGISIGTGRTQPTENDYCLESIINSTAVSMVINVSRIIENGNLFMVFDCAITNNSGADITISEIGYQQFCAYGTTQGSESSSTAGFALLLDRTVLATPLTIANGDVGLIRYKIGIDFSTT